MEIIQDASIHKTVEKLGQKYLLEGVWAGEHEALDPDISKLEHDGVSSSSLPDRRLASRTEYRRSSIRYIAGLSKSILWLESR